MVRSTFTILPTLQWTQKLLMALLMFSFCSATSLSAKETTIDARDDTYTIPAL